MRLIRPLWYAGVTGEHVLRDTGAQEDLDEALNGSLSGIEDLGLVLLLVEQIG